MMYGSVFNSFIFTAKVPKSKSVKEQPTAQENNTFYLLKKQQSRVRKAQVQRGFNRHYAYMCIFIFGGFESFIV